MDYLRDRNEGMAEVHAWTLEGAGIAVKALWDIEEDPRDGRLVEVLERHSTYRMMVCIDFLSRKHIPIVRIDLLIT